VKERGRDERVREREMERDGRSGRRCAV